MSTKSLLAFLIFVALLTLSTLPGKENAAARSTFPAATIRPTDIPPTPTPPPAVDNESERTHQQSAIEGIVTDLSTGQPAGGIRVQIADVVVRTDGRGHYSLTGLGAWTMPVRLLLAPGEGFPAQDTIFAHLDGIHTVVINLAFYSRPPTPTPLPPSFLPETGGNRPP